uniref:Vacuolar sorting protein 39/Transforming growth factor beta receptor-associated domain-containing protein n=1 Tax=Timema tahoe TaxID=61484 RepID=A0A7R9P1E0_9NEOP|nr:unnamed protein product [Timema tahoe]
MSKSDPYDVIRLFPDLIPQESRSSQDQERLPKLQDRELENGLLALIEFLTESIEQLLSIIDTTLLKCYLQTNDALVAPLLRLNHCHLEETEKTLRRHHKYSELIILYQTKGLHLKALELLEKQADQPESSLRGFHRTIQYLQHLGKEHMDLILKFAGWVLEQNPEEGLKIFTEDIQEVEHLPRPRILDYLLRQHKLLVIPYLEHVVNVWNDSNPIFHNALVHQYREKVQQLSATPSDDNEGSSLREKLLAFLETSSNYTPETVLVLFPYDCMFEERAIILGKLGRHEQALSVYVSVLGDVPKAMEYCDKVSVPAPIKTEPDLETALALLEQHANKINPVKALSALPDKVPLVCIKHFLETSLQKELNNRRKSQVLKGLLYAEHLQVQEMRLSYESQAVVMTEFNVCPVCKKRFSNQRFVNFYNYGVVPASANARYSPSGLDCLPQGYEPSEVSCELSVSTTEAKTECICALPQWGHCALFVSRQENFVACEAVFLHIPPEFSLVTLQTV